MTRVNSQFRGESVPAVAQALRQGTRSAHRRLDHHPLLQQLVRPGLTRASYTASLLALYRPQAQLEAVVAASAACLGLSIGEASPAPPRLPQLEADLHGLGAVLPLPGSSECQVADSPAALVGLRYVLDGSRLGGQVIARQVVEWLGDDVPHRFFAAAEPDWHWRRFLAFGQHHCPPEDVDRAVAAAQAAFANYLVSLDAAL
ncbi:biliverdin-producing heme oxygenase [Billgrantia montanilacus]|uniref:Heme oxygenase n=1 Tax=Billgrantia montanilacus TaxID=2282305 RepID=A0A368TYI9_9GAMM|nr:biliverdin-producing heme oxygenase [Halomonas montanilacus]RCV89416.1 hypothetical protein DU505_10245 [Halomonas montanilacus]